MKGCVNTAVFERNGKVLLVDPGNLTAAPGGRRVEWALLTHHHRDQAAKAVDLVAEGTRLAVPEKEAWLFSNAERFWETWDPYRYTTFRPHTFTPRVSVPTARTLGEGDVFEWEGLRFEVLETPGHTDGSVTYLVDLAGKRVALTGDLIFGPGQIWEMYSLQKEFEGMWTAHLGFGGASEELKASLDKVLKKKPDLLIPSHGVVMTDPSAAVDALKRNLDAVVGNYLRTTAWRLFDREGRAGIDRKTGIYERAFPTGNHPPLPPLPPAAYPPWIRKLREPSHALVADDGALFLCDCGFAPVIPQLFELRAAKQIKGVDGIWITHYHYDHNQSTNVVRDSFKAKVYIQEEMLDITENPQAYPMPATHPWSITVDRAMKNGESIDWKGIRLTFYHFPGQTEYHGGLLAEKGGFKAFFTGDSMQNWGIEDYCCYFRNFVGSDRGYEKCLRLLTELNPDILVRAHTGPMAFSRRHAGETLTLIRERWLLYRKLFPQDDPNFALDPYWIRAYPYRQKVLPGGLFEIEARILNHSERPKTVSVELHVPRGWKAILAHGSADIPARTEGKVKLRAVAPRALEGRRWDILGISATVDGVRHEEFAEAVAELYRP